MSTPFPAASAASVADLRPQQCRPSGLMFSIFCAGYGSVFNVYGKAGGAGGPCQWGPAGLVKGLRESVGLYGSQGGSVSAAARLAASKCDKFRVHGLGFFALNPKPHTACCSKHD
jgi:hypothetical protein